ncbi:g8969 [Coccomyxa viridis]|uniref:G8969 protein n=1 Tax=Coccomyxa viridis TaxID=1274662 RepID=A0ABP1G2Y0_9CHLO
MGLLENRCAQRVANGASLGAALGASIGALYGTYEAFRYKVPGIYKIRYIGQTTLSSAAVFGLFLGAGSLLHCGRDR